MDHFSSLPTNRIDGSLVGRTRRFAKEPDNARALPEQINRSERLHWPKTVGSVPDCPGFAMQWQCQKVSHCMQISACCTFLKPKAELSCSMPQPTAAEMSSSRQRRSRNLFGLSVTS
jgi:hypothetical protein